MTEVALSADEAPPERLHPLMLLSGLGGSLRGVAGGYAGIGYLAATGRLDTALVLGALLLVGAVVSLLVYWRRFTFRVGTDELRIDSGFISRTHRSIPFDRVQDVDISQGPLQRLLGLASVTFDTGASGGSKEEGALNGIALARAHALRDHVRARRGADAIAAISPEQEARPLFAMDLRRVLTAGVFNFSLAIFAGLFGLTQTMGDVIGFDPFERRFWNDLLANAGPLTGFVRDHRFGAAFAGLALLILLGLATGIVRTLARDFRFRLDRTGTGLRRRRGLFTLTDVTLPLRRVQAALILTGPVRERFGWRELKLQSLAQDQGGSGDHQVAPLARDEELQPILDELGWQLPEGPLQPVSKAYVWTFCLALLPVLLIAAVQAAVLPPLGLLTFALLGLAVAARWLGWRRTAYALGDDQLLVRGGWWQRRTLLLPLQSVQSVDLTENFIGRRFGTVGIRIGVAGGSGFSAHVIPSLPREKASQVREVLLSRFA
jgi:putative membrane protein